MRRVFPLHLISILGLSMAWATSSAMVELSFGVYTSEKPTEMVKKFRPMVNVIQQALSENLGEPVEIRIQVARSYTQGIEHLASGKVDFSRFGPASYVEAKRTNPALKIIAKESEDGAEVFYGIICVAKDSPIRDVQELKGKSFAFGDEQSTIGRYLSQQYLYKHNINAVDLSRYEYLERHDKVGTAVGAGLFDAGALNESTFNKLVKKGVPIRELARFTNVTKPWIARAGLSDRIFNALQETLWEMGKREAWIALKKDAFLPASDEDYASIREAMNANDTFFDPNPSRQLAGASESGTGTTDDASGNAGATEGITPAAQPGVSPEEPAVASTQPDV